MATNSAPLDPLPEEPREQLAALKADSASFASRSRFSPLICGGLGVLAALYVAKPLLPAGGIASDVTAFVAVGLAAVLLWAHVARTGVGGRHLRPRQWLSFVAAVVWCLVLISISLALVSHDLPRWVAGFCVTAFASVTALAIFAACAPWRKQGS